jgi:hypothetical protein
MSESSPLQDGQQLRLFPREPEEGRLPLTPEEARLERIKDGEIDLRGREPALDSHGNKVYIVTWPGDPRCSSSPSPPPRRSSAGVSWRSPGTAPSARLRPRPTR